MCKAWPQTSFRLYPTVWMFLIKQISCWYYTSLQKTLVVSDAQCMTAGDHPPGSMNEIIAVKLDALELALQGIHQNIQIHPCIHPLAIPLILSGSRQGVGLWEGLEPSLPQSWHKVTNSHHLKSSSEKLEQSRTFLQQHLINSMQGVIESTDTVWISVWVSWLEYKFMLIIKKWYYGFGYWLFSCVPVVEISWFWWLKTSPWKGKIRTKDCLISWSHHCLSFKTHKTLWWTIQHQILHCSLCDLCKCKGDTGQRVVKSLQSHFFD